ncbi:MAG: GNAT family N-acetyltransferase [Actinomycetota bacterium]|nr:GNAT family N-acetyltransferase [Actinomycetota bacterium]
MKPVAVCGPVNLETSAPAGPFPIRAAARRMVDGIEAHVSGIACNVAAGLAALGTPVRLTAITGTDEVGRLIRSHLATIAHLEVTYVDLPESPQTVVLLGDDAGRSVLSDLKGAPSAALGDGPELEGCSAFVPVAIPANLPALERAAGAGIPVFVDIQSVAALDDPAMEPFCRAATVLAMSGSRITGEPEQWLRRMGEHYGTRVMVLGLGQRGAMLARDGGRQIDHVPAVVGPVKSTVGAGDALWACFIDGYLRGADPLWALQRAVAAAGHKVASIGGTQGLATTAVLEQMGWGPPGVSLRDVIESDLPTLFEHQSDPEANAMAGFPARTKDAHYAHWHKLLADDTLVTKAIVVDGRVAGNIGSWQQEGEREIGYWIGKDDWGKGIATSAVMQLLELVRVRPLYAHVVAHNGASLRVLEKCGFKVIGVNKEADGDEVVLVLTE